MSRRGHVQFKKIWQQSCRYPSALSRVLRRAQWALLNTPYPGGLRGTASFPARFFCPSCNSLRLSSGLGKSENMKLLSCIVIEHCYGQKSQGQGPCVKVKGHITKITPQYTGPCIDLFICTIRNCWHA